MAKRPITDVDEEHLKEIMAGGLGRSKKEQPKTEVEPPHFDFTQRPKTEETETETETDPFTQTKEPVKQTRKKREAHDYESLFLERKASVDRRQTYIDADLHKKVSSFLPVIAGHQFSVPTYISNILAHHLELHKEDINELYERKSKKPF